MKRHPSDAEVRRTLGTWWTRTRGGGGGGGAAPAWSLTSEGMARFRAKDDSGRAAATSGGGGGGGEKRTAGDDEVEEEEETPSTSGIASDCGVVPYEATSGWGSQASEAELKGIEGGDCERGVGGETRREKSLRIGVNHADAVVRGPVYRSHLHRRREQPSFAVRDADELGAHAELLERGHDEEDRRDERAKRPERG